MEQTPSINFRKSYSVQYLKSFAQSCQELPHDINLQEINSELENVNSDWSKASLSPSSENQGKHPRRRRHRRHAKPQGASSAIKSLGFNPEEPEATTEAKLYISEDKIQDRGKFNRTSLAPLKLQDHIKWGSIADENYEEINLAKNKQDASSCEEFSSNNTKQKNIVKLRVQAMQQASDSGDSSPSSCSSEKKIDLYSLFVKDRHRAKPMPAAPTVQDIEKQILTDKETSEGEPTSPDEDSRNLNWNDDQGKAASQHILSVLQKRTKKSKPGESEKELLGELISSSPISAELSNLDDVLKRYEKIAASDLEKAESESSVKPGMGQTSSPAWSSGGLSCSPTVVDSMRTSVKKPSSCMNSSVSKPEPDKNKASGSRRSIQSWYWAPNAFVQSNGLFNAGGGGAPLVPQALHALQRLVDHQLHILNSIPGEVTPGMLHERLSRSVLGYPPTGTQLVFTTYLR